MREQKDLQKLFFRGLLILYVAGVMRVWCQSPPDRQFVTESSYINSLSHHPIRSTIKTLPATLPEPSSQVQVPTIAFREPRNGVTDAAWQSALGLVRGGGG